MSAMVTTVSRSPSVRAGVFGAILGATLALGIIFVLTGITTQADRSPGIGAVGGPAAALDVQAALRAHLAREYGSIGGTSPDVQAALRAHLAREYRADLVASPSLDVQAALRAHLAREYGSIGGTSPDVQAALRAHLAREYRADLVASPSLDVQAALRAHLRIEYGQ